MLIGVLKEIKTGENRVSMIPDGVEVLTTRGHRVLVERGAGLRSGFSDEAYAAAGAELITEPREIFERSELLLHVKEPQPSEYPLLKPRHALFTYLHLAASRPLTEALLASGVTGIAYETVEDGRGSLPLLTPMSEVAGRMAAQEGAKYLERSQGGRGILLGGVTGVAPAQVMVLGGGVVGMNAAQMACGLGAQVYLLDTSLERLRQLRQVLPANCTLLASSPAAIRELLPRVDLVIGAVLIHGAKAPRLIRREMLGMMQPGAVLVDVAIDQGGCFETSRPTTHEDPVYLVDGIVHYAVANMPGGVPLTSTRALTNATLPYVVRIAEEGWRSFAAKEAAFAAGINCTGGVLCCRGVGEAFGIPWHPFGPATG